MFDKFYWIKIFLFFFFVKKFFVVRRKYTFIWSCQQLQFHILICCCLFNFSFCFFYLCRQIVSTTSDQHRAARRFDGMGYYELSFFSSLTFSCFVSVVCKERGLKIGAFTFNLLSDGGRTFGLT